MPTGAATPIKTYCSGNCPSVKFEEEKKLPLHTDLLFQSSIARLTPRTFATANDKYANVPELNQTHGTSIPPVTPPRAEVKPKATTPTFGSLKVAKEFKKVSGKGITETYTAYGATEELFKACGAQADYSIPQASDSEAEMPKTEEGEDLGVGKGWWHERKSYFHMFANIANILQSWDSNLLSVPGHK